MFSIPGDDPMAETFRLGENLVGVSTLRGTAGAFFVRFSFGDSTNVVEGDVNDRFLADNGFFVDGFWVVCFPRGRLLFLGKIHCEL